MCIIYCCVCVSKFEKNIYVSATAARALSFYISLYIVKVYIYKSSAIIKSKPDDPDKLFISTMDAIVQFLARTKSMATYIELTMDYASTCRPATAAIPVTVATVTVYCTDGIGPLTMGSTVALDTFFGKVDDLAANRPLPDSALTRASMLYAYASVAAIRRTYRIVCHNRRHHSISNCTDTAFGMRPQTRPIVRAHKRRPPILGRPTIEKRMILHWYGRIACNRPDTVQTMLCSSYADSAHNRYNTDHGRRPTLGLRALSSVDS